MENIRSDCMTKPAEGSFGAEGGMREREKEREPKGAGGGARLVNSEVERVAVGGAEKQ